MSFIHKLIFDEKIIGTGSFSTVVVGTDPSTGNKYAVKRVEKKFIMMEQEERQKKMIDTAKREYEMLTLCNHRNIVKFFASGRSAEYLLYALELCEGGELLDMVRKRDYVPLEACRYAMAELFSAVFYMHHGKKKAVKNFKRESTIIHRDIKPENIMLSGDWHIRLIDFGTAVICQTDQEHARSDQTQGRAQTLCGTSYYMSPELLQENYTCCASDYWACGCVLYYLLTGKRPFDAATDYLLMKAILEEEPSYPADMDPEAVDLIKKLLTKAPEKRPGMDGVKKHPFFSTVDFNSLHTVNMKELWMTETPWIDDSTATTCPGCQAPFGRRREKEYSWSSAAELTSATTRMLSTSFSLLLVPRLSIRLTNIALNHQFAVKNTMSEDEKLLTKLQWLNERSRRDYKGNPPPFEQRKTRRTVNAARRNEERQMAGEGRFLPFWHGQTPLAADAAPSSHLHGCINEKFSTPRPNAEDGGVRSCLVWNSNPPPPPQRKDPPKHSSCARTDSYSINCMPPAERAAAYRDLMLRHPKIRPHSIAVHQDRWARGTQLGGNGRSSPHPVAFPERLMGKKDFFKEKNNNNTKPGLVIYLIIDGFIRDVSFSFITLVVPVALTLFAAVCSVTVLPTFSSTDVEFPALRQAPESGNSSPIKESVTSAAITVALVTGMTFLVLLLYKCGCTWILYGWFLYSCASLFIVMTWVWLKSVLQYCNISYTVISMGLFVWNFGTVGVVSVLYYAHPLVRQGYLVFASLMVICALSELPERTAWALLLAIAIYDVVAVLCPYGPLRLLVEEANRRSDPLPGLVYDANSSVQQVLSAPVPPLPTTRWTGFHSKLLQSRYNAPAGKLGLGDFIFYGLLVGKAAQHGFIEWTFCFAAVILGMVATFSVLVVYRNRIPALPALPLSIFLASFIYVTARYRVSSLAVSVALDFAMKWSAVLRSSGASVCRPMLTPQRRESLSSMYSLVGSHSAVKLCRWQKSMLRDRGGCYKWTMYGIASHRCMEATPNLACANNCDVVREMVASHRALIQNVRGMPGVKEERLEEAFQPRHCALSLVGEPLLYPQINKFLQLLHQENISTFLVTNGQFPDSIPSLTGVTQLYLSIDAPNSSTMKILDRPIFTDFWDRFQQSVKFMRERRERTVFRLTLIEGFNMSDNDAKTYAQIIAMGEPDFIELKRLTPAFQGHPSNLLRLKNVPSWTNVKAFANRLCEECCTTYRMCCVHEHSGCILLAKSKFLVDDKFFTWIDFKKFHDLICKENETPLPEDYWLQTPQWALADSPLEGFDPQQQQRTLALKPRTTELILIDVKRIFFTQKSIYCYANTVACCWVSSLRNRQITTDVNFYRPHSPALPSYRIQPLNIMPPKHSDSDDDNRPRNKAQIEGDAFEDQLDHQRAGHKKGVEVPSHQIKPKSLAIYWTRKTWEKTNPYLRVLVRVGCWDTRASRHGGKKGDSLSSFLLSTASIP
eukprot:gene1267-725_t